MTRKEVQIGKDELEILAQMGVEAIVARLDDHQTVNIILRKLETEPLSSGEFAQIKQEIQDRMTRARRSQNPSRP